MKKNNLLIFLIVTVLVFSLVACKKKDDNQVSTEEVIDNTTQEEVLEEGAMEIPEEYEEIPVVINKENKKVENDEINNEWKNIEKFVEYSIEHEFEDGIVSNITFGYYIGEDIATGEKRKKDFAQINGNNLMTYRSSGKGVQKSWDQAISIVDLDKNDKYQELKICFEKGLESYPKIIHYYRIIDGEFFFLGETPDNFIEE